MLQQPTQTIEWWQWPAALARAVVFVVAHAPTAFGEAMMAGITGLWGVWLLLPFSTFASSASFREMQAFAPEWAWGAWFVVLGVYKVLTLGWVAMSPSFDPARRAQLVAAGAILLSWATVLFMLASVNWRGTGTPVYGFLTVAQLVIFIRQGRRDAA